MAHFVIENFSNGLDRRKSPDTAPAGSLRVLRNAFINEGGEIEKRLAFVLSPELTAYAQGYKGSVTGPHPVPGYDDAVYFRHRAGTLPGAPFTAGSGSVSEFYNLNSSDEPLHRAWVMSDPAALPSFGAMFHAASVAEYADKAHIVEAYWPSTKDGYKRRHVQVSFTSGEPTLSTPVPSNDDRDYLAILKTKAHLVAGSSFFASAVGDPTDMTTGAGFGVTDTRTQGDSIGSLLSMGQYYGQLALFGRKGVQFWSVDPDFAQNAYLRTVQASLLAPRTVTGYGDGDVVFLGRSGIRSLMARDSSNLAKISDIGTAVDPIIKDEIKYKSADREPILGELTDTSNADFYSLAVSTIHNDTGHLWNCLKDKVYVLSRYPDAGVRAWSVFDLPKPASTNRSSNNGFTKSAWVADICQIQDSLILRNNADEVYLYGGASGTAFDGSEVEVITPHMDFGKPGTKKTFSGIDLSCTGTWTVEFSSIPPSGDEEAVEWEMIATVTDNTHQEVDRIPFDHVATHVALRITSTDPQEAKLGQITLFYDGADEK